MGEIRIAVATLTLCSTERHAVPAKHIFNLLVLIGKMQVISFHLFQTLFSDQD